MNFTGLKVAKNGLSAENSIAQSHLHYLACEM
jgi:hypothetical protein